MSNGATATVEDRRAAVEIKMSLSSYLISAALTVLGVQVALITFVLDKRESLLFFGVVSVAGALLLVASMFVGGKGITEAYKKGFAGNWQVTSTQGQFSLQAALALAGVFCVAWSAFLGRTQPDIKTSALEAEINNLKATVAGAAAERRSLSDRVLLLESEAKKALPVPSPLPPKRTK
jgi:hypothetical protein